MNEDASRSNRRNAEPRTIQDHSGLPKLFHALPGFGKLSWDRFLTGGDDESVMDLRALMGVMGGQRMGIGEPVSVPLPVPEEGCELPGCEGRRRLDCCVVGAKLRMLRA